jgi:NAD(P)-dependent dehydrogenase (short-subunit alcohol dehydrogenase family)
MVASRGQAAIDFDDPMLERSLYEGRRAYAQSKLAQITYAVDLAGRLGPDAGVTINALHPSTYMPTKIVLEQHGESIDSLERGLEATLRLAFDPALDGVSGRYFDREDEVPANQAAYDPQVQRHLRELSERLAGEFLQ